MHTAAVFFPDLHFLQIKMSAPQTKFLLQLIGYGNRNTFRQLGQVNRLSELEYSKL